MLIIIISVVIVVILSVFYVLSLKNFDNNLLNNKWYHYNKINGYTEILYIDDDKMTYYKPSNDSQTDDYSFCSDYKYNKSTKTILFDCGKKIVIKDINSHRLDVSMNEEDITFFKSSKYSKEYEFNNYFGMTIDKYKNSKKQALEIIKIDSNKLLEVLSDKEYSKIIIAGDNCSSVECALLYDVVEKWISYSKNIYYINANEINEETIIKLNSIDNKFLTEKKDYDDVYPNVYVVSNNKVIDKYKIICDGFSCAAYYNK